MFVDKARIFIKAGDGGSGHVSFRKEKYVNNGGPDGGDGGDGGSIIFEVDDSMRTLMDFAYSRRFEAQSGERGGKKNMRGRTAEDLIIRVPAGTVIKDDETGRVAADMREGRRVLLKGGAGGKGNSRFATSTRQAPNFATPGKKTKGRHVRLELLSIADVGLLGFPNVGKSTLLSASTSAKPKIANYHFTTLSPNLGVVRKHDQSFIIADIPGLIEGAAAGAGLGHDFLRHVERTRMLIHVLDVSGSEGRDVIEDYEIIRRELADYSEELTKRPELVAANKMDLPDAEEHAKRLREYLEPHGAKVYEISAETGEGVEELMEATYDLLMTLPMPAPVREDGVVEEWALEKEDEGYEVYVEDGVYYVDGSVIKEIMLRTNPADPDSMRHFQKLLIDFGIIKALRRAGAKTGDAVCLEGLEFDFVD